MGQNARTLVGCIVVALLVVSATGAAVTAVGADSAASTELIVETQDRIDDDGKFDNNENTDGDNVYASIQAAIDAAPNGAIINVTRGTYNESVLIDKPNIKLIGNASGQSIGPGANAPVLDAGNERQYGIELTASADDVVIEGFEIRQYSSVAILPRAGRTETSRNLTVRDNSFTDTTSAVLFFSQYDGAKHKQHTVTRNDISNTAYGVNVIGRTGVSNIEGITITENSISSVSQDGVQLVAFDDNATIAAVTVRDNDITDATNYGIELTARETDTKISNADIERNDLSNAQDAIRMRAPNGASISTVDIRYNDLVDSVNGTFVNATATNGVTLRYNTITGNDKYGVLTSGDDILSAERNWWGDASGPTVATSASAASNSVSENVSYEPYLTRTVDVQDGQAPISERTTVAVTASAADVAGYELELEFDTSVVNVTAVEDGDFPTPTVNVDNENGTVRFTQATSDSRDTPALARVEFNVTAAGSTDVTVDQTNSTLFDVNGEAIESVSFDAGVVENSVPGDGDVNGDEQVDAGDVVLLQRYIVGDDVDIDTDAADVDGDGDVDPADVLLIKQAIVEG